MKRIRLSDLTPGMVTAEEVFNYNDKLILPKNHTLTEQDIERLETFAIMSIRIDDSVIVEAAPADSGQAESKQAELSYSDRVKASPEFKEFKDTFIENLNDFRDSMNDIVQKGAPVNPQAMLKDVASLINAGNGPISIFDMLQNMRQFDDLTYAHCLNVALICNVFAGWLHMSPKETELVTLCGVFHDIGKLCIPDEIVKKPAKLTDAEYNIIKKHPAEGYRILMKQDIDDHVKNAALMHHERCDGTGYPFGLSGNKIDKYAKIVAIADVYDAMTAARVYRGPLCPFTVIEIFEQEGLQRYDAEYILTFLENVVLTYMGNQVKLSDGREGKVVFINKTALSKPMIELPDGTFVDLSKEDDLKIDSIL